MKSWIVKELGEPSEALQLVDVSRPSINEGEVLIKVEAAALNFFDILQCQGKYQERPELPFTIGAEISGTIAEVSKDSKFKVGDKVSALPKLPRGGLAELVPIQEDMVFPVSHSMTFRDAASMMITYHTSYYALHQCGYLKEGEVLVVHAGAGGVGSAAIQLGKAAGAFVIATAGGSEKTNVCKELGADIVIDYLSEDFVEVIKEHTNGRGADVIFDPVGGDVFDRSRKCIAFAGRILVIGFAGGKIPEVAINHILIKNYSVVGVHWGYFAKLYPGKVKKEHQDLMDLYEKGLIKPLIQQGFQLTELPEALHLLAERKTWGKLIIEV